jgi:diguanylate cyclase (GGDEF)-like protein
MLKFENNRIFVYSEDKSQAQENNRILIVDDSESIHDDLKKVLTSSKSPQKDQHQSLKDELFGDDDEDEKEVKEEGLDLNSFYYEIDSAFQGQEALRLVELAETEGRQYALIFMDVRMPPGWDGIETIAKIWEKYPFIEVVICSAYSDYPWEKIVQKLGKSDKLLFLEKPFATVEVQQMTLALIRKWNLDRDARNQARELESKVLQRTYQLETLLNNLNLAIIVTENDSKIIFSNPMAREFFNNEDIIEKQLTSIIKSFSEVLENIVEAFQNLESLPVNFYGEKNGAIYKFTLMNLEEKNTDKPSILFLIEDVTDWHKRMNTDGLTGLWNHRYFKEVLDREIKKSQRYKNHLSLIMLDVDHFKNFNDTYGHQTGDIILKSLSGIMQKIARETDIVTRYGGEEFAVILTMTDEAGANVFARRIMAELEKMDFHDIYGKKIPPITVSIGISFFSDGLTISEFIEEADQALYSGKHSGRNCVVNYSEMIKGIK